MIPVGTFQWVQIKSIRQCLYNVNLLAKFSLPLALQFLKTAVADCIVPIFNLGLSQKKFSTENLSYDYQLYIRQCYVYTMLDVHKHRPSTGAQNTVNAIR